MTLAFKGSMTLAFKVCSFRFLKLQWLPSDTHYSMHSDVSSENSSDGPCLQVHLITRRTILYPRGYKNGSHLNARTSTFGTNYLSFVKAKEQFGSRDKKAEDHT
jgi:hypothetical protein